MQRDGARAGDEILTSASDLGVTAASRLILTVGNDSCDPGGPLGAAQVPNMAFTAPPFISKSFVVI